MEAEVAIDKVQQNIAQRQQLETAYRQTYGAIVALYEFAPPFVGALVILAVLAKIRPIRQCQIKSRFADLVRCLTSRMQAWLFAVACIRLVQRPFAHISEPETVKIGILHLESQTNSLSGQPPHIAAALPGNDASDFVALQGAACNQSKAVERRASFVLDFHSQTAAFPCNEVQDKLPAIERDGLGHQLASLGPGPD